MKPHFYQKGSHILIIWVTLLLFSSAQPQKHIEIIPFQDSFQISASNPRFYSLDLTSPPKGLDLLISVLPEGKSCTPKLFVSKTKEFPQKIHDADYSSTLTSGNVLVISHKDLKDTPMSLFIGLDSEDSLCSTNILVEWTKEIKTIANEEKAIANSNSIISAIVRLAIPKEKDIERIVIHVDALKASMRELLSLEVFINQGTNVPFMKNAESVSRKGAWFEGKTMVISKDSKLFCTDCTYTLSLKFTESSSINVQAHTFKKNMQISGTPALDGVRKGMRNTFRFKPKDLQKEEELVLSVKVHQGEMVKVFMNCGTQPQSLEDYSWQYDIQGSKEIILNRDRIYECSTGSYFLVTSDESSVYSLRVIEGKSNQLLLGKSAPAASEISPQEKITYELLVPLFLAEDQVVLDLHEKQSLDLTITLCKFPTDCPGLLPASSSFKITNYYGFDDHLPIEEFNYEENTSDSGRIIEISPKEHGCYPILVQDHAQDPIAVCAYLITLSNKKSSSSIEFTLTSESKGPKLLRTSEPYYDIVAANSAFYYALPISYRSAESVQLRFTKYFGDFDVFVSKSNKSPDHQETPLQSPHEGLLIIKDLSDSEVYFIGVYALKASSFSFSAVFSIPKPEPQDMNEDWAFTLSPGKPQKGFWGGKNDYAHFYKFILDQDDDWKGSIFIKVNTSSSVQIMVNNNGKTPLISQPNYKAQWKSMDREIEISFNESRFKNKAVYSIGLYAIYAMVASDLAYEITYTLKGHIPNPTHTFLSPKIIFSGDIKKGESQYFESLLVEDESHLTISKQSASKNIDLYFSTDPKNKYPSQDSYDFMTKDQLTLTWSEVCKAGNCPVYITVVSKEASSYSLLVKSGSAAIVLEDGQEIQLKTPRDKGRLAVFYFQASPKQNSVIRVSCPGREFVIYAKRTKLGIESLDQLWREAPDENTAEFISENGVSNITVPRSAGSNNITIAVYFNPFHV